MVKINSDRIEDDEDKDAGIKLPDINAGRSKNFEVVDEIIKSNSQLDKHVFPDNKSRLITPNKIKSPAQELEVLEKHEYFAKSPNDSSREIF